MKKLFITLLLASSLSSCVTTTVTDEKGVVTKTTRFDILASESLTNSAEKLAPIVVGDK